MLRSQCAETIGRVMSAPSARRGASTRCLRWARRDVPLRQGWAITASQASGACQRAGNGDRSGHRRAHCRAHEEEKRMVGHGLSIAVSKLASLGLAAKIGVGATIATASVAGAGAAGALPDQANERAREAIEAVTPITFDEPATPVADQGDSFGDVVSSDATGGSDDEPGVDGSEISSTAPGAAHRPTDPGQAPSQAAPAEGTGLDQAADTPAAPALPDDAGAPQEPPSTIPDAVPAAPETSPSTVPEVGGPATDVGTSHR